MCVTREGFDLLGRIGRRNFFASLRRGEFPKLVWRDTFGRILCFVMAGHDVVHRTDYGLLFTHCPRCNHWLEQKHPYGPWSAIARDR